MELQKLLNDITNELIDTNISVSSPLLKTKVFAQRSQSDGLLRWVNSELEGYTNLADLDDLPEYRKKNASVIGSYVNGRMEFKNMNLPLGNLPKKHRDTLSTMYFSESITALEASKTDETGGLLQLNLSGNTISNLTGHYRKCGYPDMSLYSCRKETSATVINDILSNIRSKLLDFVYEIEKEFNYIVEIEDLKSKKSEIQNIMDRKLNIHGNGIIVNTGNQVSINATINVSKGNKQELNQVLSESGITTEDVSELMEVIDADSPDYDNKTFGTTVNGWMQKMLAKAMDGSWQISLGAAGSLLAEAIQKYYGM